MLKLFIAPLSAFPENDSSVPLSDYRRERLSRISHGEKRHEAIAAEALANLAVSSCWPELPLPLDIITGQNGKPYLRGGELFFNLSHSGDYVVCALSDKEVGVDIQLRSACKDGVVKRFFSPQEQEYVFSAEDRDSAFTEIWSRKESYIKATGSGLSIPLADFSVLPDAPAGYSISHGVFHGHHVSLCIFGKGEKAETVLCGGL